MLNEEIEYTEYTDENAINCGRLFCSAESGKVSLYGERRALGIIARKFYYDTEFENGCDKPVCTINALKSWLGDKYCEDCNKITECSVKKEIDKLKGRYYDFCKNYNGTTKDDYENPYCLKIKEQYERFNRSETVSNVEIKDYPAYNHITYENIVANAISSGPLKNYCLCCKKDIDKILEDSEFNGKTAKTRSKNRMYVLMMMSAILLNKTKETDTAAYIVQNDVNCWMGKKTKKPVTNDFKMHFFENTVSNNDISRLSPNSELKECDFKLIDNDDTETRDYYLSNNYYVFEDKGTSAKGFKNLA